MKKSLITVYTMLAVVLVIAYIIGGGELILEGLVISGKTVVNSILMILVSFIIIGQINVLLTQEQIEKWLNKYKGIKAVFVSALAGGIFPGGPYIYYPFILSFKDKKLPVYMFISFIFGKQIYDFSRLPMEASLVNPQIAIIRYLITLPIPIIVGLFAKRYYGSDKTLGSFMEAGGNDGSNNNNS